MSPDPGRLDASKLDAGESDAGRSDAGRLDAVGLVERLSTALSAPAGAAALSTAVGHVLALAGAPTRPDGPDGSLADRWRRGEPLAEDTDWRSPLGPFRDPDVGRGTLGELCAARLVDGRFAGDALLHHLVPFARATAADLLAGARDRADADAACLRALARVIGGAWTTHDLAPLVPATVGAPVTPAGAADR